MFKIRFISMLVLLLMAVSGAWARTVTWNSSDIQGSGTTITKDGVTFTGQFGNSMFQSGTFTTSTGKFTKIEMSAMYFYGSPGTGWSGNDSKKTWQGTASNSVSFNGRALMVSQIVFTIEEPILVTEVTLNKTEATLILGETLTLTATVTPDNAEDMTVTWTTSDASVATVTDGVVTTVGAGTATITATATNGTADTSDDKTATCAVTVTDNHKTILTDDKVDTDNWTFTPAEVATTGVEKNTQVKVNYNGRLKIKSVTVTVDKKPATSQVTTEDIGKVIGADGNIYNDKDDATTAGTTAVAMIAYVGSESDCENGLAIALSDESSLMNWSKAVTAGSGKTSTITGASWRMPSMMDWQYMFIGCGASGTASNNPSGMSYSGLASKLIAAGGTALQPSYYWSSSYVGETGLSLNFTNNGTISISAISNDSEIYVRSCLVF